ncbi:MAG: glycosyltransferase family 4 protein [bacterium]|nr:glycosyltransferase family 4 protein [bacterium]
MKHKKLRIAQVSPLWYRVPPKGYGGTELIVSRITEELIKRGHEVTLFASGDSKTRGKLVSVVESNLFELGVPWLYGTQNIVNLMDAYSYYRKFDIIHTHIDVHDVVVRHYNLQTPSVATLHNPFWPNPNDIKKGKRWHTFNGRVMLYDRSPRLPYVAISNSYRKLCPAKINFAAVIHHGIDIKKFSFNPTGSDKFVWLGRISPAKGVHIVAKMANKLGLKLLIAGKIVNPEAENFFKTDIRPHLNRRVKFIGEIKSDKEKSQFFGDAKAFLYPLQWQEPFGITMIESQACGTPVIALKKGSVPEIVKHKKTGFVVDTLDEFKESIKNIDIIDRRSCRQWAEDKFTIKNMVDKYEAVYYDLIKRWPQIIKN